MAAAQPRYVAYAAAHGRTPDAQLAADRQAYPGGRMAGFIVWVSQQLRAWRQIAKHVGPLLPEHHAAFDAWLDELAEQVG